jgi:hypothetical protein
MRQQNRSNTPSHQRPRPNAQHLTLNALLLLALCLFSALPALSQTLKFSGYEWEVRSGDRGGPGPNAWSATNVWLDAKGWLHLKISHQNGDWSCAEVTMNQRLGFGTYQFQVMGHLDKFDRNVVLGLFNYPPSEIGPDGTNEIDIEFAHWGRADAPIGNYTVWPAKENVRQTSKTFDFTLKGDSTTQRFIWNSQGILFQSLHGRRDDNRSEFGKWLFQPMESGDRIPQQPLPVHINLWLFQGQAPFDGKEVEIVIQSFKFTPDKGK